MRIFSALLARGCSWPPVPSLAPCLILTDAHLPLRIATKVNEVYEVEVPAQARQLLNAFSIGVSFGFASTASVLECLGVRSFLSTLIVYMIVPAAVAVVIVLGCAAQLMCMGTFSLPMLLISSAGLLLKLGFVTCARLPTPCGRMMGAARPIHWVCCLVRQIPL